MKRERYDSQQVGEPSKTNRFRQRFSRAADIVATGGIILFSSDEIVTQETPDSKFKKV